MKIILASASPRRHELLSFAGVPHEILVTDADENPTGECPSGMMRAEWFAAAASAIKGEAARQACADPDAYIIAADTVVSPDGESVFGKPRDAADAAHMLRTISGGEHYVLGGITVVHGDKSVTRSYATRVRMKDIPESAIEAYVASGEPYGKAGAYAIQGMASVFVDGIDGDYANVVGISVSGLETLLSEEFGVSLTSLWEKDCAADKR